MNIGNREISSEYCSLINKEIIERGVKEGTVLGRKYQQEYLVVGVIFNDFDDTPYLAVKGEVSQSITYITIRQLERLNIQGVKKLTKEEREEYRPYIVNYKLLINYVKVVMKLQVGSVVDINDSFHYMILSLNPMMVYKKIKQGDDILPSEKKIVDYLVKNKEDVISNLKIMPNLSYFFEEKLKIEKQYNSNDIEQFVLKLNMLIGDITYYASHI